MSARDRARNKGAAKLRDEASRLLTGQWPFLPNSSERSGLGESEHRLVSGSSLTINTSDTTYGTPEIAQAYESERRR